MNLQNVWQLIQGNWIPFAAGYASAHVVILAPRLIGALFLYALKNSPVFRGIILKDPVKSKAVIDGIAAELDKDIDAMAAEPASVQPPAVPPVSSSGGPHP